ncbi:MAG: DUF4124 domain-containing protein, partial [Pseudomonadota bacterium]
MKLSMVFASLMLLPLLANAAAYKCRSAEGAVSFSDSPRDGQQCVEVGMSFNAVAPSEKPANDEQAEVSESLEPSELTLAGRWVEKTEGQTITLSLSRSGKASWKVIYQGKPWSEGKGTYTLTNNTLNLSLQWTMKAGSRSGASSSFSIGVTSYKIVSLTKKA